jgi:UTP-glucose-1-phosphate uridylyltransferase
MRPATRTVPKELLPVGATPAIQHVVAEALAADVDEVLVVTAPGKQAIADHLGHPDTLAELTDEDEPPLAAERLRFAVQPQPDGLGDAILHAEPFVDGPFAVLYPDNVVLTEDGTPAIARLVELHEHLDAPVAHAVRVAEDDIERYSAIDGAPVEDGPGAEVDGLCRVDDVVEKPAPDEAPSRLSFIGRHVLDPSRARRARNHRARARRRDPTHRRDGGVRPAAGPLRDAARGAAVGRGEPGRIRRGESSLAGTDTFVSMSGPITGLLPGSSFRKSIRRHSQEGSMSGRAEKKT